MSDKLDRATRIHATMQTGGWRDISGMLIEQAKESEDKLTNMMAKSPDTLTGKTALKYAIRANALRDFLESLLDEVNLLHESRKPK